MSVKDKMPNSQHGFQPGKGTLTAWKDFFERACHKQNIIEFDLEKFFDTVNLKKLFHSAMMKYQIPYQLCQQLLLCNMQLPSGLVLIWNNEVPNEEIQKQIRSALPYADPTDVIFESETDYWTESYIVRRPQTHLEA
jgi:hypothetical protein